MRARLDARATSRSRRRLVPAFGLAGVLLLTGCGGTDELPAASATTTSTTATATTTSTTPPTTTVAPTTTAPTTVAPSTSAPTTTVVKTPLPQPISPPTDIYADEPVIEMGSILIPAIDIDTTMYEGIRLTTLDKGPGHWPGSAVPGQTGNLVVGGHRSTSHQVFRNVDQLEPGDAIVFRDDTGEHTYAVSRIEIVDPSDIWIVTPTETPTATLFACHPFGSTAKRIVVFADLVSTTGA